MKESDMSSVAKLLEAAIENNTSYSFNFRKGIDEANVDYYGVVKELSKQINFQIKPKKVKPITHETSRI